MAVFATLGVRRSTTVLAQKACDVDDMSADIIAGEIKTAEAELAGAQTDDARMMAETLVSELKRLTGKAA